MCRFHVHICNEKLIFCLCVHGSTDTDTQADTGPADLQASTVLRVRGKKNLGCQGMFIKWAKPCSPDFTPEWESELSKIATEFQSITFSGFMFVCLFVAFLSFQIKTTIVWTIPACHIYVNLLTEILRGQIHSKFCSPNRKLVQIFLFKIL